VVLRGEDAAMKNFIALYPGARPKAECHHHQTASGQGGTSHHSSPLYGRLLSTNSWVLFDFPPFDVRGGIIIESSAEKRSPTTFEYLWTAPRKIFFVLLTFIFPVILCPNSCC